MKRLLIIGAALLIAAGAAVFVAAQLDRGRVFIAGDQPVNADQVRQKLQAEGWSDIRISETARFITAVASRNGREETIEVEAQTGRLRITDDDEEVSPEDERK